MIEEAPWEKDPESWKQSEEPTKKNHKVSREIEFIGVGIRPTVKVKILDDSVPFFVVDSRDELKTISTIADGQKVLVKESNENFHYDVKRNMWVSLKV